MLDIGGFIVEVLILLAVVWEGWISWKHYKYSLTKKERADAKRKGTMITRWLWK